VVSISTILKHYKRRDIQEAIVDAAEDKEISVCFNMKYFGKRPDVLLYPQDVLEFAKKGASSFHCSEELWHNPLQLSTSLNKKQLNELRKGWDLILDIDCKVWQYSQVAADLLVKALEYHNVSSVSVKFSGNHGFHIAVPFEAFPKVIYEQDMKDWFPEGPRRIAAYLKEMISPHLKKRLSEKETVQAMAKRVDMPLEKIMKNGSFDPFSFLEIDTVLISSRHLYRMPYSLNEKSGLVSIPVHKKSILEFDIGSALPENVVVKHSFLDRKVIKDEARQLCIQAFDFVSQKEEIKEESRLHRGSGEIVIPDNPLPEICFPPCVHLVQQGLKDGRKRAVFMMINFLDSVGWNHDEIKEWLYAWNKNNFKNHGESLREQYIVGQLRYHKEQKKHVLPPNCSNENYMKGLGVCKPNSLCRRIKNPAQYAKVRARFMAREQREAEFKKEEREKRKQERKEVNLLNKKNKIKEDS
jgi:hypothetical protein